MFDVDCYDGRGDAGCHRRVWSLLAGARKLLLLPFTRDERSVYEGCVSWVVRYTLRFPWRLPGGFARATSKVHLCAKFNPRAFPKFHL